MSNALRLDENYSTTRALTKENPSVILLTDAQSQSSRGGFETILFLPEGEERKGEGGLRTKEYYKKSYKEKPLISIITVVFNGEKYLEETIRSVINQTYDNVEYIIIDGGSSDGTLDIVKKYEDRIDYWVSERDKGIYDAMNKGIDVASGEWINFMNAGDGFYDVEVLESVFSKKELENIDVIYGNHKVIYPHKTRLAKAGDIENIWKGSQFCHQSSFIASNTHKVNKFNLANKIGADFEFFYTLYKKNKVFKHIDIIIANYSAGGLSDIKRVDSVVGRWNVIDKNNIKNLHYIWMVFLEMVKSFIKKMV